MSDQTGRIAASWTPQGLPSVHPARLGGPTNTRSSMPVGEGSMPLALLGRAELEAKRDDRNVVAATSSCEGWHLERN
jgi:hypothetical protein